MDEQLAHSVDNHDEAQADVAERLLESGGIAVDRLPMLKAIVDRLASSSAEGFRALTTAPIYMLVKDISVGKIGHILDSYESHSVLSMYNVKEWDSRILIGADNTFVFSIVEMLFGGDGSEAIMQEERALTNIEVRVAMKSFEIIAASLKAAFSAVTTLTFGYERTETRSEFAVAGRRNNLAVCARIGLQVMDRTGEFFVVIPQQALNPLRQLLSSNVASANAGDPKWSRQIEKEIHKSEVSLYAILDSYDLDLDTIAQWKPGTIVPIKSVEDGQLRLECKGYPVFLCELGRSRGFYTVRVKETIDPETTLIETMGFGSDSDTAGEG
jgi:flagellar motor switch protein FliM